MTGNYIAHVRQAEHDQWLEHALEEHLRKVAGKAGAFSQTFNSKEWGYLAGLWHDLGKYRPAFQAHIKRKSGYQPDAHITSEDNPKTAHASTGAVYAEQKLGSWGLVLSYLIAGHHAGLPDYEYEKDDAKGRPLKEVLKEDEGLLAEARKQKIPEDILNGELPGTEPLGGPENLHLYLHLWIRMLFSCLVDADFLDTEHFMSPKKNEVRTSNIPLRNLLSPFNKHMESFQRKARNTNTKVNQVRAEILSTCREKAAGQTGIYTMTVPTGGGKTLSSLAFALEHASSHNKARIIYVIPYTSIIEQTANIFRDIFKPLGEKVLIEHHSNTEPDKEKNENSWSRLATQNWDAPLIVTTTVQLFESLYAARTSRCRKLHNLINSVIVLDESQLLPLEQLNPILHIIEALNKYYGVTFVMTTATPPGFKEYIDPFGARKLQGISSEEIIDSPENYYETLKRVHYTLPEDFNKAQSWDEIAEELLNKHDSVLAIVNTRKDARELWERMPKGSYHLSALMCAEHRSRVIEKIKERLESGNNEPTRVISTQLVEAGVDLDFPIVYRALAGLDSIVQAGGRCNREGKLEKGEVVVFIPPNAPPEGLLLKAAQTTKSLLHNFKGDIEAPDTFKRYFDNFCPGINHDKGDVLKKLQEGACEGRVQFRTAAKRFRMIDDKDTVTVFVRYGKGDALINSLSKGEPDRGLLRKLQRYTVTLYQYQSKAMMKRGDIEEIGKGFYAQSGSGIYDENRGLLVDIPDLTPVTTVI